MFVGPPSGGVGSEHNRAAYASLGNLVDWRADRKGSDESKTLPPSESSPSDVGGGGRGGEVAFAKGEGEEVRRMRWGT